MSTRDLFGEPTGIERRQYQGTVVEFRRRDRYVNATAMCRAAGTFFERWHRNDQTIAFLAALEGSTRILADRLVQIVTTGPNLERGTWIHPWAAIHLAMWANPNFAVWVCSIIDELALTNEVRVAPGEVDKRMLDLETHLSTLQETSDSILEKLERFFSWAVNWRARKWRPFAVSFQRYSEAIYREHFGDRCIFCVAAPTIFDDSGRFCGDHDHWDGNGLNVSLNNIQPMCSDCNQHYKVDDREGFRATHGRKHLAFLELMERDKSRLVAVLRARWHPQDQRPPTNP